MISREGVKERELLSSLYRVLSVGTGSEERRVVVVLGPNNGYSVCVIMSSSCG
jgi:hypothetical protein